MSDLEKAKTEAAQMIAEMRGKYSRTKGDARKFWLGFGANCVKAMEIEIAKLKHK